MTSKGIILFYRVFNGGLGLFFIIIVILTFQEAYQQVGAKFPGFLVYKNRLVSPISLPHWSGPASGILFPYRVDSVDGEAISSTSDLTGLVEEASVGEELLFTLKDTSGDKTAPSKISILKQADILSLYGLPFVTALIFFLCGLLGWFARAERGTAQALFLFCTLMGLSHLLLFDMSSTYRFYRLYLAVVALLPASLLQLSLYFPTRREFLKRFPSAQWYPYAMSVFMALLLQAYFYQAVDFWLLAYQFNQALILFLGFVFILTAVAFHRESESILVRLQAKALLVGSIGAFGLPLMWSLASRLSAFPLSQNLGASFSVLLPLSILYAAVKHDLFPMSVARKKTVLLTFMTSVFSLGFAAVVLLTGRGPLLEEPLLLLFLFVIFILLGGLFYGWEEGAFQRTLSRRTERYRQLVEELNRSLQQFRDERGIAETFLNKVVETMGLVGGAVFTIDRKGEKFHLAAGRLPSGVREIDLGGVHRGILREIRDGIEVNELFQKPGGRELGQWLVGTVGLKKGDYFHPVFFQEDLTAMVILGEKREWDPYNPEDTDLLKAVIGNLTVALANAQSQKREEEQRAQMIQMDRLVTLGTLTTGLGHEIRNPMFVIGSFLLGLEQRLPSWGLSDETREDVLRGIERSKEAVRRAVKVCENLSEFSREGNVSIEEFDVHRHLDNTLELLNELLKGRITVHKDYQGKGILLARGGSLNQVFANLLTNASQAIDGKGDIWIRTERDDSYFTLSIRDSGCGISKEHLPRIFDPFFTTKDPGKGTGLGLYLSSQIVEQHRGRIEVQSEEGKGTEFRVILPLKLNSSKGDSKERPSDGEETDPLCRR